MNLVAMNFFITCLFRNVVLQTDSSLFGNDCHNLEVCCFSRDPCCFKFVKYR